MPRHPLRRVHRYVVTETWGDAPEWVTSMVGDPEAFMLDAYRGPATQWEVEKGGEIVYGFTGDYAGVSPVALAQGIDDPVAVSQ